MIQSFRHKGLKRFYEDGDFRGVIHEHVRKLENILARLDAARIITDMDVPGFVLHQLKGDRKDVWSVTVRANWRVTFRFEGGHVVDVNYEDYH
jgi:toxin HigB-1